MDFSKLDGLIPAVVQDETSNEVLMVGFMNDEAWRLTRQTGFVTFFSRTRNRLWMKGETSGNRLQVRQLLVDCDDDTVLIKARREGEGNVCHLNRVSCFRTYIEDAEVGERR
jgi:phosphoribosyl-AMP cyclohydrolase